MARLRSRFRQASSSLIQSAELRSIPPPTPVPTGTDAHAALPAPSGSAGNEGLGGSLAAAVRSLKDVIPPNPPLGALSQLQTGTPGLSRTAGAGGAVGGTNTPGTRPSPSVEASAAHAVASESDAQDAASRARAQRLALYRQRRNRQAQQQATAAPPAPVERTSQPQLEQQHEQQPMVDESHHNGVAPARERGSGATAHAEASRDGIVVPDTAAPPVGIANGEDKLVQGTPQHMPLRGGAEATTSPAFTPDSGAGRAFGAGREPSTTYAGLAADKRMQGSASAKRRPTRASSASKQRLPADELNRLALQRCRDMVERFNRRQPRHQRKPLPVTLSSLQSDPAFFRKIVYVGLVPRLASVVGTSHVDVAPVQVCHLERSRRAAYAAKESDAAHDKGVAT